MRFLSQVNISDTKTLIKLKIGCRFRSKIESVMYCKTSDTYKWHGSKRDRELTSAEVLHVKRAVK